jgi:misacylated tRNA(Ala) deacylase
MTHLLFRDDPYLKTATVRVAAVTAEGGIVPDATIFYPQGGGQPGDAGRLDWEGGGCAVVTTAKGPEGTVVLVAAEGAEPPPVGAELRMTLDWERRHRHMRMHTALHLLSVAVPLPVTGGQVGAGKSRLDFDMPEPVHDRDAVQAEIDRLVGGDHPVTEEWIDEAALDANPGLVKTLSVQPPRGAGRIRLVRIGDGERPVDLQPCGGTHVRRTGEIGPVTVGKIENKGRANRRISITLGG